MQVSISSSAKTNNSLHLFVSLCTCTRNKISDQSFLVCILVVATSFAELPFVTCCLKGSKRLNAGPCNMRGSSSFNGWASFIATLQLQKYTQQPSSIGVTVHLGIKCSDQSFKFHFDFQDSYYNIILQQPSTYSVTFNLEPILSSELLCFICRANLFGIWSQLQFVLHNRSKKLKFLLQFTKSDACIERHTCALYKYI